MLWLFKSSLMIHVVVMKCLMIAFTILVGLLLLGHIYDGVGDLKIEESDSEVLCTDSTALFTTAFMLMIQVVWIVMLSNKRVIYFRHFERTYRLIFKGWSALVSLLCIFVTLDDGYIPEAE
jgi:hypothetical protein